MIQLIRNENMKIYKRKRTWLIIILLILYVLIQMANLKSSGMTEYNEGWKTLLQHENSKLTRDAAKSDALPIEKKMAAEKILMNQYYLDHNIAPQSNAWSFTVSQSRNLIVGISLLALIVAGDIVASEFSAGTIKFLLTRSATRSKIYFSKYIATLLLGIFLVLLTFLAAIFFGGLMFGFKGIGDPYFFVKDQTIQQADMIQALLGGFLFNIPFMVIVLTFAFMISAAFRSVTFSIVFSMLAAIAGFVLSITMNGWPWTKYFVFSSTDLNPYFFGTTPVEGMTLGFSLFLLLLHLVAMHLVSYPIFTKRDVI
ncbi:ABC transporter permease [Paenibacillus polymyxa]|uniref:ABC transporter permease n=1 Tax=Paenibacillus polymyxa TaxID=1406 RepID=UPI00201A1373|nr:ABC transporter permease subunit [Paenibacillus polymyxa]UQQ36285.1 ABC transporter permease [Paenibacillus polymyxa]